MATSYTPGLKVLKKTLFKTKRILPLKGNVHVKIGQNITSDTIVASTNLPGNVQMVKLSNILNIEPKDVENWTVSLLIIFLDFFSDKKYLITLALFAEPPPKPAETGIFFSSFIIRFWFIYNDFCKKIYSY